MQIAHSPVLTNGMESRQVVMEYRESAAQPFVITTISFHPTEEGFRIDHGSGIYTKNAERARHTFLRQWEILSDQGFNVDIQWHSGEIK